MWDKKKLILSVLIYLIIAFPLSFASIFIFGLVGMPITMYTLFIFWFRYAVYYAWISETEEDELRITRREKVVTIGNIYVILFVSLFSLDTTHDLLSTYGTVAWLIACAIFLITLIVALYYFAFIPNEDDEKTWKNFFSTFFKKGYM